MNNEQFKKGIAELKNIRLTDVEKTRMLERVISLPIKSPYMRRIPEFAFACSLILLISFGGVIYASDDSLPGDILYPIKISFVEPVFDAVNRSPENKIVWETEKVERRIVEAEKLAENDNLDDLRAVELERKIEKSSRAFIKAVEEANSGKSESRKEEFRRRFETQVETITVSDNEDEGDDSNERVKKAQNKSKIEKLKRTAIETIDRDDDIAAERVEDDNSNDDDSDGADSRKGAVKVED